MVLTATTLEQALQTLGELLDDRGHPAEVVAIGGGSLLLTGFIERPTKDLDLVAIVEDGEYATAKPLPDHLAVAAKDVAAALGLADLTRLYPSDEELLAARAWCVTHDVSAGFADQIDQAIATVGVERE